MPTLAVVHDAITDESSIGLIAAWDVREALRRGWRVLAVCADLADDLVGSVVHLPLRVPPRLHLLQYAVGRTAVRLALRGQAPDVVVTHQPQAAALADVWNVHYLERAALQVIGSPGRGARARVRAGLDAGVAALEDRYVRDLPATTRVLFCSDAISEEFARLHGSPPNAGVVPNPALHGADPLAEPDVGLRRALVGEHRGPVVGFLGGGDRRKGGDLITSAVAREPDLFLVHAGPTPLHTTAERTRALGHLSDVRRLLDAVDALVVPSRFEPFGLVVVEAAARGVPVLVTPAVGAASLVVENRAGLLWDGSAPLTPLVTELIENRARYAAGGARMVSALDRAVVADRRFAEFDAALARRRVD